MGRNKKSKSQSATSAWLADLGERARRAIVSRLIALFVIAVIGGVGAFGLSRLEAHVDREVCSKKAPSIVLVDLPSPLVPLASNLLHENLSEIVRSSPSWTDDAVCRAMVSRLESTGWVSSVQFVRRNSDGLFEVSCRYRVPVAMVQQESGYVMVDGSAVRVPGTYSYDASYKSIQGVRAAVPRPGETWAGDDLRAALKLIDALSIQPFAHQVSAVIVDNMNGRVDPRASHVVLATDRAGGKIRWGSAPGKEIEENSVQRKLAILADNFRRTGRLDANYIEIEISTYPDRFTVPG